MKRLEPLQQYVLCYLATPYSKYHSGIHNAFIEASKFAAELLKQRINVYSPIAHTHPLAIYGNIDPLNHDIWLNLDNAMLHICDALIVAEMDGWQDSKGINYEVAFFHARNKPVYHLPGDMFT